MKSILSASFTVALCAGAALAQSPGQPMDSNGFKAVAPVRQSKVPGKALPPAPAPRGVQQWQPLGPFGGDVTDVNVSPTNPALMLAGLAPSGGFGGTLYRSTDSGATWAPVPDLAMTSVFDIEFAPDGTAWIATQDSVWVSTTNAAQSFTQRNLGIGLNDQVFAVEIDPSNPAVLWAGVADAIGSQTMNVLKSTDSGATWTDVTPPGFGGVSASDIAIDPANTGRVMVTFAGAFGGGAVAFTSDGGSSWSDVSIGLPGTPVRAVKYSNGRWFLTGGQLFGSQFFGLYRSTNDGASWDRLDDANWPRAIGTDIAIDAASPDTIYVASVDGLHKSADGGATWAGSVGSSAVFSMNSVRLAPGSSTRLSMGASSFGVVLSDDAGAATRISSIGIGALDVFSVAANPLDSSEIAAAFQGTNNGGVYTSTDGGQTWSVASAPGTRYNYVKFDASGTLYAISDGPIGFAQEGVYRRNPDSTWTNLGPNQGALFESELYSLDFGQADPNLFFTAGNDFGVAGFEATIWRSPDAGAVWTKVYESLLGEGAYIQRILVIPDGTDQTILAAASTFGALPLNGLFRSTDSGLTWARISGTGLPETLQGYDMTTLPGDPNTVFLADGAFSGGGMYISHDAGATWSTYFTGYNTRGVALDPTNPDNVLFWAVFAGSPVYIASNGGTTIQSFGAGLNGDSRQLVSVPGSNRVLLASTKGVFAYEFETPCRADFNDDGSVNSQDFFDFLTAFFGQGREADFNEDGTINSQDFFDFLGAFFAGC